LRRERIELLHADDDHVVVELPLVARLEEIVIDFARAEHDALDRIVRPDAAAVEQYAVERRAGAEIGELRNRELVAQQRFRRHHDERLSDLPPHLPPQHVEIICRRRAVDHLHVLFGAELEIALEPRRAVLGPLPFVAVRQEHDEARHAQPFRFAGGDELIDDDLGPVGEIAELRLPQHEAMRLGQRIAVFEAEHRGLGQRRIDDLEIRLARLDVAERNVFLLVLLIDEDAVALREGAAPAILAREPDRRSLGQQRAERQRLARRPIDALAGFDGFALRFELAADLAVEIEALRRLGETRAHLLQHFERHAGFAADVFAARGLEAGPGAFEPIRLVGSEIARDLEILLELFLESGDEALRLLARDHFLRRELLGVDRARRRLLGDRAIHQRLGKGRLVAFVVTVAPVTPHVDDDVFLELVPEFGGDARHVHDRLGVVAVDVEDRRLHRLGDVGAIRAGARIGWIGREADLIIDDEVDRTARAVAFELRERQRFGHEALAGEGGVAVQQQAHHLASSALEIAALHLLRAHLADDDGVHSLQVGGIGRERQMDGVAVEIAVRRGAEMVLHVARALHVFGIGRIAAELREDRAERLAHHVGEHVEPAAVRHAEHDLLGAELAPALDDLLQRRDHGLGALEAEALGAGVFLVEEALEDFGGGKPLQDRALAVDREIGAVLDALQALLDPEPLRRLHDVHVFDADAAAVGVDEAIENLLQRRRLAEAQDAVDEDRLIEIGFGEAIALVVEILVIGAFGDAERIEIGDQVPARAVGADQHERADRGQRRRAELLGRSAALHGAIAFGLRFRRRYHAVGADHARRLRRPGRAGQFGQRRALVLAEPREERAPARIDRAGIAQEPLIELRDEDRVARIEERIGDSIAAGAALGTIHRVTLQAAGSPR
jgi:hypothetical protein